MPKTFDRLSNGELPGQTWPGLYPIIYILEDGGTICAECANGKNGSIAKPGHDYPCWNIVDRAIFFEGAPITCTHCNKEILPAYSGV